jgi:DNA polymerase-3 subunit alpha
VTDGAKEIVGGMITKKTIKYTKTNKVMAFLTIEDLVGTVEVVVFPRDYERNYAYLEEDAKVFVRGRVSEEDDAPSKLICEAIIPFEQTRKELWIQYADKQSYLADEKDFLDLISDSEGEDSVVIYCKAERAVKRLSAGRNVHVEPVLLGKLMNRYGESRVKVVEKSIEKP